MVKLHYIITIALGCTMLHRSFCKVSIYNLRILISYDESCLLINDDLVILLFDQLRVEYIKERVDMAIVCCYG